MEELAGKFDSVPLDCKDYLHEDFPPWPRGYCGYDNTRRSKARIRERAAQDFRRRAFETIS